MARSVDRVWNFRCGYRVKEMWARHESSDQYAAFQQFLRMPKPRAATKLARILGYTPSTLFRWSKTYNWDERAAAWDKYEIEKSYAEETRLNKQRHREAIQEFRDAAEKQAKDMMEVSQDLTAIIANRIKTAEAVGEEIPMNLVAGLLRATANISEQGRQAWAAAIGVDQLMEVVDVELQAAEREEEQNLLEGTPDDDGVFEFEVEE